MISLVNLIENVFKHIDSYKHIFDQKKNYFRVKLLNKATNLKYPQKNLHLPLNFYPKIFIIDN